MKKILQIFAVVMAVITGFALLVRALYCVSEYMLEASNEFYAWMSMLY